MSHVVRRETPRSQGWRRRPSPVWGLLLFLGTCNHPLAPVPPAPCPAPVVSTDGWREMTGPAFTFLLPPDMQQAPRDALGNSVTEWRAGGLHVGYDWGQVGDGARYVDNPSFHMCSETVNGRVAQISTLVEGDTIYALGYWERIRPDNVHGPVNLVVYGRGTRASDLTTALAVIRTVRILPQ